MEYFEILNDFISNNRIDPILIPYIVKLFEINRDLVFWGEENRVIKKMHEQHDPKTIATERLSFINSEITKIDNYILELRSLKTIITGQDTKLIDDLISDKEKFKEKLKQELTLTSETDLSKIKTKLEYNYENNRKNILLGYSKIKEIKYKFEQLSKLDLFNDLEKVIREIRIKSRINEDESFLTLMAKIEKEYKDIDKEYLNRINYSDEVERFDNPREHVTEKKDTYGFLSDLFDFNDKYSKPLSINPNIIKIAMLEHRVYANDIHVFFEKVKENPELRPYYEILDNQFNIINKDIEKESDQELYLNTLLSLFDTIKSLKTKLVPLKVNKGIFSDRTYNQAKIVSTQSEGKVVKYKDGEFNVYSIVEDRFELLKELDFWDKEINYGFDRYNKDDFYEEVKETFNLIKFYYRFSNYILYNETSNKIFNMEDSKIAIEKDKNNLNKIKEFLTNNLEKIRLKGMDHWKTEKSPDIVFSKLSDLEKKILFECIIPKDGIGREIRSPEMFKLIYGEERVTEIISEHERIKGK